MLVHLIGAQHLISTGWITSKRNHTKVSRGNRTGFRINATDHEGRRWYVIDPTMVGSVPRRLLDRHGTTLGEVLCFDTLKLRPESQIEILDDVSFAHVDRYERNEDLEHDE
jgi:hypothetical protein